MTFVSVSRIHFPVTTLGPGRRIGVWLQGCSIRCPGCISVDTWATGSRVALSLIMAQISAWCGEADGLTISGGEPFDQPDALATVLRGWRKMSDASVLVFTGHELPAVEPWLAQYPGLIDALITGPFRSDLPQTLALRGSDNQQLHSLTEAGDAYLAYERVAGREDRRLDAMFDPTGDVWFAGIPARGDLGRLRRLLAAQGHQIDTSDRILQS